MNQILTLCLLSAPTGASQLKVETTATQPELSSEAKPTPLAPSSGGGTTNSITSSVSLSDQKNPTEKSDQKVVTIENSTSASAAPCALPTTTSLSEKKPLTSDANEIHDFDGRHYFLSYIF